MDPSRQAFRVAYDGRDFHGYQRQPSVTTVEGTVLAAFDSLGIDALGAGSYAAAGRTDAGVSAIAQTIAVSGPCWLGPGALNAELPSTITVWASGEVSDTFHPRYDALERQYTYVLHAPEIDCSGLETVASRFIGTHDFRHLSATATNTIREIRSIELTRSGPFIVFEIAAPSFIHEQVRRIVGLLDAIGRGDRSPDAVDRVLDGDRALPGEEGVQPAPPNGLVLSHVEYAGVRFERQQDAFQLGEWYRQRSQRAATRSHVLAQIGAGVSESDQ